MTMDDDKLSRIFADYDPKLPDDAQFMAKLERNMRAVEFIREKNAASQRRNRMAMIIACIAGFTAGCAFTAAAPYVAQWIGSLRFASLPALQSAANVGDILAYGFGGILTVLLTLATYDVSLSMVSCRRGG